MRKGRVRPVTSVWEVLDELKVLQRLMIPTFRPALCDHPLRPLVLQGFVMGPREIVVANLTLQNYSSFTSITILMPKLILDFTCLEATQFS